VSYAARLKQFRMRSGKSLQELADAIGVSKGHLWDLESGNSKNPSIEILKKLSDFYGTSIATLAGEVPASDAEEKARVMFRNFEKLTDQDREMFLTILRSRVPSDDKNDP
jgi:transcriptional regulator with XRE-family HTH domain